ncbi:MAG: dihydrolipoyl dehydrogenase [Chloroflexi bacterium]|nr:dihydrolipoyl dehydrogenase [Chloroflexota bacterium]
MPDTQFDLIIIGGGPGGYVAAIRAAQLGMKSALVERDNLGGICLNWGCIPTKTLIKNAEVVDTFNHAKDFGVTVEKFSADYGSAIDRSRVVSNRLVKGVEFLMKKNKIEIFKGDAVLTARDQVQVKQSGQTLTAKNIIIATGARPRSIPGLDLDGKNVISSREALELKDVPNPLVIVGASAIGVEFATIYHPYGADVTILEALPHLLPKEDEEVSVEFEKQMQRKGIQFKTNAKVEKAEKSGTRSEIKLHVTTPQGSEIVAADKVLVAVGIQPNSENLGLEALGIALERGAIAVNEFMQTNVPGIYAIGDVTMKLALAHVASAQGITAVEHLANKIARPLDYNAIPRCTYSDPQVASLGLTEAQARELGGEIAIGKFPFRVNGKALGINNYEGFIKIISDKKYGEILGVHMIGPEVTDLTGEFALAKSMEMTPLELAHAVHAHPSLTEVIGEAALATYGEAIHM